jgi:hypothetical protein
MSRWTYTTDSNMAGYTRIRSPCRPRRYELLQPKFVIGLVDLEADLAGALAHGHCCAEQTGRFVLTAGSAGQRGEVRRVAAFGRAQTHRKLLGVSGGPSVIRA